MDFFPSDPKKLKIRIRTYERALRQRNNDDGYGKRFLVGPMYLLLGDIEGALKYYDWFKETYSDDGGEPYNELCWALALHLGGDPAHAVKKLRRAIFSNLYLVPHLLGEGLPVYPIWHGCNFAEPEYARTMPRELAGLWTPAALEWVKGQYSAPEFQKDLARYLELEAQVKDERPGPRRTELLRKAWAIAAGNPEQERTHLRVVAEGDLK